MAEPVMEINQENKFEDEEEEVEIQDENLEMETNTSVHVGLNLVLILSFLSLSSEECANLGEFEDTSNGFSDHKSKQSLSGSNLQIKRREMNGFRASGKQTSKIQTKIRDCRHCRRM